MDLLRAVVFCTAITPLARPLGGGHVEKHDRLNSPLIDLRVGALGLVCGVGGVRRVCGRGPVFRGKGAVGAGQPISPSVPEHPARPSASAAPSPPRYRHRVVRFSLMIRRSRSRRSRRSWSCSRDRRVPGWASSNPVVVFVPSRTGIRTTAI